MLLSQMQKSAVLVMTVMVLILAGPVLPQSDSGWMSLAAARLAPDEKIMVETKDGREIKGRLLSISPSQSILTMYLADANNFTSSILRENEIAKIKYYRKGKVRPLLVIAGTVVGFVAGIYIEELFTSSGHVKFEPFKEGEFWHGDYIGSLSGFTVGLIIPMLFPSARDIICDAGREPGR